MTVRLSHRQKAAPSLHPDLTASLGVVSLSGQSVALRATKMMPIPGFIPYAYTGVAATLGPPQGPIISNWDVLPPPSFTTGVSAPYNVAATIPNGFTAGGTFGVAIEGTALPTGMTFTSAGSLDVGTATSATTTGVKFAYYEPGTLPILTLNPQATVAGAPYMATAYPLEGVVPSGSTIVSPDDVNLRSYILNTWPDGSARVVVMAGAKSVTAAVNQTINLRVAVQADTPLTTSTITAAMASGGVVCDFGGGIQTLSTWTAPDRIWWATSQVICARYRLSLNRGTMEAVIDVHAFVGGRAFIEVMIENSNVNYALSSVALPAAQAYTAATVKVNGVTFATVNSSHASFNEFGQALTETTHLGVKSWYTSGWIGGDPLIEVTHDAVSMQAHPAFNEFARTTTLNMQTFLPNEGPGGEIRGVTYQNSVYTPWNTCYQRSSQMQRGSDEGTTIGRVTQWDSFYLMTGSKYPRRASIANALAITSFQLSHRDSTTHAVPTHTQAAVGVKQWASSSGLSWPYARTVSPNWDMAHHPATGLVAFMCRPSPIFIELAQRVAIQNATYNGIGNGYGFGFQVQTRGHGWGVRSLAHALFLTPDNKVDASTTVADPWKSSAQDTIITHMNYYNGWLNVANPLRIVWDYTPINVIDQQDNVPPQGFQFNLWQFAYLSVSVHKLALMKVAKTANQALVDGVADWMMEYPIRYVNEAVGGEWRFHKYQATIGTTQNASSSDFVGNPGSLPTWHENTAYSMVDGPPAEQGIFVDDTNGPPRSHYAGTDSAGTFTGCPTIATADYMANFWHAFCMAIERDRPGADAAWARVNAGITPSLSSFLDGATVSIKPRDVLYPRNK